jgi:hypothetical protein
MKEASAITVAAPQQQATSAMMILAQPPAHSTEQASAWTALAAVTGSAIQLTLLQTRRGMSHEARAWNLTAVTPQLEGMKTIRQTDSALTVLMGAMLLTGPTVTRMKSAEAQVP